MKKNYYTSGYKKRLINNDNDFMEPAENFIRIFKMNFLKKDKLKCLDFGVGDGRHTKFLLERKHNVLATDVSDEAIKLSKKNIKKFSNYLIIERDNFKKLLDYKFFDLIICWETIHWIGDIDKINFLIKIFEQICVKKGNVIITFPSEDDYYVKNSKYLGDHKFKIKLSERKNAVICAPKINVLKKIFENNKFRILQIFKYSHGRVVFNKLKVENDMKGSDIKNNLMSVYAFVLQKS